ncbi:MAG: hypothetical protein KKA62_05310 [Nanoarchaeota archaeon]|nr:hypothetical protein [Nanoarchaeota archaeon]MBU1643541.1 hypothetical protein [Nanoarchaeota archaeon]MBU1977340.1 hypothetical protein [Nanoarchaeota archaeon]
MYRKNSDISIKTAQKLFDIENEGYKPYLWVIVTAYYSMFYIANAVLLSIGYKVGEKICHKVTSDALIVFVRNKLKKQLFEEYEEIKEDALELTSQKARFLLSSFDYERKKRSRFQYKMNEETKKGKALISLNRAKEFVFEMKKLL